MIKFEKVSLEQYIKDCRELGRQTSEEQMREEWENIKLPQRSTVGSAGYDFYAPYDFDVKCPNERSMISSLDMFFGQETYYTTIVTGIRWITDQQLVLICAPRSGQGFRYGLRLANSIGVVDQDFHQSDNEGHIKAKLFAEIKAFHVNQGQAYMQGLILPYYATDDDKTEGIRNGGFGSTDRG